MIGSIYFGSHSMNAWHVAGGEDVAVDASAITETDSEAIGTCKDSKRLTSLFDKSGHAPGRFPI
jgi:hypothetical protein